MGSTQGGFGGGEADEVEQVERGAATVEDADEVRERWRRLQVEAANESRHSCNCALGASRCFASASVRRWPNRGSHARNSRARSWKAVSVLRT